MSSVGACTSRAPRATYPLLHTQYVGATDRKPRQDLLVSSPLDLGVYVLQTNPQCLPTMAGLRPADDYPPLGMDRDGERGGRSTNSLLHSPSANVHLELRARRLGYS